MARGPGVGNLAICDSLKHQTPGKCARRGRSRSHRPPGKLQIPYLIYSGCSKDSAWENAPVVQKPREHLNSARHQFTGLS